MPDRFGRRSFLTRVAVPGVVAGFTGRALARAGEAGPFAPLQNSADAQVFAEARKHFLFPTDVTYCNTGTLGASPREVVDALANGIRTLEAQLPDWPYFLPSGEPLTGYQQLPEVRGAVGAFVNAPGSDIALTQNATIGINIIANGLDLAAGDEVVSTDQEHGGAISAFRQLVKRRGIVLKEVKLQSGLTGGPDAVVKLFADAMTPRTKLVMFSHITSGLGILLPARALCALARERGALSLVDGAQAVGQIRVDVKDIGSDAYAGSPHKWMLAPKGTGFMHLRPDVQDRVWTTLASQSWDDRKNGAFRFMQYGTGSVAVVDGLVAALKFINAIGMERIERWDAMLTKRLRDGLAKIPKARLSSPPDPRFAAAITTFRVDGVPARDLQNALWAKKIRVRAQGDDRGVRLSAHLYVSPENIDTVLDVARSL